MKRSESSVGSDEGGNKTNVVILGVGLALLCCLLIIAVVILFMIIAGGFDSKDSRGGNNTDEVKWQSKRGSNAKMRNRMLFPDQSKIQPKGKRVKQRFYTAGNMQHLEKQSLDAANGYCKQLQRKLPVPKTDLEELDMIEDMKAYHALANCTHYAIGYKLDGNMRYSSLDKKNMWPPLSKATSAASEIANRDCIRIEMGPKVFFRIVDAKPCSEVMIDPDTELVMFFQIKQEHCKRKPWSIGCFDMNSGNLKEKFEDQFKRRMGVIDNFLIGPPLLDRERIPRRLLNLKRPEGGLKYWMFEVNYLLNYLDIYNSNLTPYEINVTVFQDPERDCLAVNSEKGFQIETILCDEAGCPACEEV